MPQFIDIIINYIVLSHVNVFVFVNLKNNHFHIGIRVQCLTQANRSIDRQMQVGAPTHISLVIQFALCQLNAYSVSSAKKNKMMPPIDDQISRLVLSRPPSSSAKPNGKDTHNGNGQSHKDNRRMATHIVCCDSTVRVNKCRKVT